MTTSETERPAEERLPYEKPVLRSISLVADQVLGVGCKTAGGTQTAAGNFIGCISVPCNESGS